MTSVKIGCYWCAYRDGLECGKSGADLDTILKSEKRKQIPENLKRLVKSNFGENPFYIGSGCASFIMAEEIPEEQREKVVFT